MSNTSIEYVWLVVVVPTLLFVVALLSWLTSLVVANQIAIAREVALSLKPTVVLNLSPAMGTRDALRSFSWIALSAGLVWTVAVFALQRIKRRPLGPG